MDMTKNPYSCFDGYSVVAVSSIEVSSSNDESGTLIIKKTSDGWDISDYKSESSYRFLADSSNIENIENNRIYIKYPKQVFSDNTVIFGYYILEYSTDELNVSYSESNFEDVQFLYHVTRKKEVGTDLYEEEYLDCNTNEPALKIKKNNDETYQIQIIKNAYHLSLK